MLGGSFRLLKKGLKGGLADKVGAARLKLYDFVG